MYFSWGFLPTLLQTRICTSENLSILSLGSPKILAPGQLFCVICLKSLERSIAISSLNSADPAAAEAVRAAALIFFYIRCPPCNTFPATSSGRHQQERGIKTFWLLWLSRGSFPCMKDSDGSDPDGIRRLLHFVRLSQTLCENLVCLFLCKLGQPDSCALLLSRCFCRTFFEFLADFLLYPHLFL